jgi:hypothetical protein
MASMLLHCALLAAGNVDHWLSIKPGKPDSWAIFRCGAITDAGKLALSPM